MGLSQNHIFTISCKCSLESIADCKNHQPRQEPFGTLKTSQTVLVIFSCLHKASHRVHKIAENCEKAEYTELSTPGTKILQFTAAVTGGSTPTDITWSLSGVGDAGSALTLTPGTDGTTATLTIKTDASLPLGQVITVTATCASVSGSAQICIFNETLKAKFIQIRKGDTPITSDSIANGETVTYTAKVYDQYGEEMTGQTVNWTSSATDIASVSGGTVTAHKQGTATLTASCGTASTTLALTVTKGAQVAKTITITRAATGDLTVSDTGNVTETFTATVTDQDGEAMPDASVNWSISPTLPVGMTFSEGTLTVTKEAAAALTETGKTFTVTASAGTGVSDAATVVVKRAPAVAGSVVIQSGNVDVSTTDTIAIPTNGTQTKTYSAKVLDQYGLSMQASVTWNFETADTNVTFNNSTGTVTVNPGATEKTYKLTATVGSISKAVNITVSNIAVTWPGVTIKNNPTYGDTWSSIVTLSNTSTTAAAAGTTINGTVSLVDATGKPDAGQQTYTLQFTGGGYTVTKTGTVDVAKRNISNVTASVNGTCTYTGTAQTPAVTVTDSGAAITSGDYGISYADNISAGTAKVTVTGKNNYQGTKEVTFRIAPVTLVITGAAAASKTYDGTAQVDITGVTLNGIISSDEVGVNIAGLKGTLSSADAGDYTAVTLPDGLTLTGTAKDNYTLTQPTSAVSTAVTIAKKTAANPTIELDKAEYGYTGSQIRPVVTVKDGDAVIPSSQYTVTYGANVESGDTAGSVTIAASANSNYTFTGTLTKNFKIIPQSAVVTPDKSAYTVAYGDMATVKITVSTAPVQRQNSRAMTAPTANQAALFNGTTQITEPQTVAPGTPMTFTVDTQAAGLTPGTYALTAKYIASQNLSAGEAAATLNVTKRILTPVLSGTATKTFDNTTACDGAGLTLNLNGALADEIVTVSAAGYAYDNANAGTSKTVTASGLTLGGAHAGNYQLSDNTVSTAAGTINKATRTITVTPAALTLLPGRLNGTISASVTDAGDLDKSAAGNWDYSLTGDITAITLNTAAGEVKAVGNGTVTVTIKVKETANYMESAPAAVTITAITDPVLGITSVTSSQGTDQLTGTLKDGKVILSGFLTESVTIDTIATQHFTGVTTRISADGKNLEAVYDDNVIAAYPIDITNVVTLDSNIALDEIPAPPVNEVTGTYETAASDAVTNSATKVEGLLASAAQGLQDLAKKLEEQKKSEIEAGIGEGVEYTIEVKTSVAITAKELTAKVFTLDIEPKVTVTAVKDGDTDTKVVLQSSSTLPNSYIKTEVTVSVKLPAGFPTANLYARHYLTDSAVEILPVTVTGTSGNEVATWKQSSFSKVELFSDDRGGTVTFRYEDGNVVSQTYTFQDIGTNLPVLSKEGSTFDGWVIDGGDGTVYKTITDDFLNVIKSGSVTLKPKFTANTPDPGPVDPTPAPSPSNPGGSSSSSSGRRPSSGSAAAPGMVSIASASHGSVSVSPKNPTKGKTVTLTVRPNGGYILDSLKVIDSKGAEVSLTKVSDTKYTFTMPAGKVSVDARFVSDGSNAASFPFTDAVDNWARDAIAWAYENGYVNGTSATTFNPNGSITRQQMWMILARLSGASPANMAEAREWAMSSGVTDGTSGSNAMTRQQMVTFLYRYAQLKGYTLTGTAELSRLPDSGTVSSYAQAPLAWAVENSIVAGTSDGRLNPGGTATRGQFAVILQRFYTGIVEA